MFTDIQGSTELWERMGTRFQAVLERHNDLLREVLKRWHGYEVKTQGDSFMISFNRATDAVHCAIDIQRALARESWPPEVGELLVRIGLHTGEPLTGSDAEGRPDYWGPMVNRAARVADAGHGGQILLSRTTRDLLQGALPGNVELVDRGVHRLRGLEHPESLFEVRHPDLPSRPFPPLRTLDTSPLPSVGPEADRSTALPTGSVPVDLSQIQGAPFFQGREVEMDQVAELLRPGAVVRLAGEGGIGKTTLAVEVAQRQAAHFPGGVFGLSLEPLPSRERAVQVLGEWLLGESFAGLPEANREGVVV
jgi:class 3 adenylate cyclase